MWHMGLDFLKNNGARRVRNYDPQPLLLNDGIVQVDTSDERKDLDYEMPHEEWQAIDVLAGICPNTWEWRPVRFIDGKDVGRTVAWLQTRQGNPIPVRISEIGAVVMQNAQDRLRREFEIVERVVSLIVDPFPWDEVESFALALQERGFRLLPCKPKELSHNFEEMRKATQNRTLDEMTRLERQALARKCDVPTLVDGRLDPRAGVFDHQTTPVVGLIKTHTRNYLHPKGWSIVYEMQAGQRTPAFQVISKNIELISWYLRLSGQQGEQPDWGIVRLEIPKPFFEGIIKQNWSYLDYLSRVVYEYRCRDNSYGRAPISIYPIQRAEESLGSLFTSGDTLAQRFYCFTNL
jgi:hypothetical protein